MWEKERMQQAFSTFLTMFSTLPEANNQTIHIELSASALNLDKSKVYLLAYSVNVFSE